MLLTVLFFLSGCNNNTVFKEYHKMKKGSWNRLDIQTFEVPVNRGDKLDFYLSLRHHTHFPYNYIDVNVTFFTPNGEMRSRDYHHRLIGTDLKWKGDGMGELWDIDLPVRDGLTFRKSGICEVRVESKMSRVELPGILEVGLIAKKSE